jgi:superfamily II DNA helicase RecQ
MDLPDIRIVVQWKATCDLCTLWQRFGRAARGPGQEATAILFVEKKDTDEERVLKAARTAQRLAKKKEAVTGQKRKAGTQLTSGTSKQSTFGECTNHDEQTTHTVTGSMPLSHEKVATERREQCRAHGKSQIKGFKMTEITQQLQINLFDWRDEKAVTKFPQALRWRALAL